MKKNNLTTSTAFINRYFFLSILSLLLYPLLGSAQGDSVILKGRFADTTGKNDGNFECLVLAPGAPFLRQTMFGKHFTTQIKNGKFVLSIPSETDWLYVFFTWENRDGKEFQLSSGNAGFTYLLNKSDSPDILIRSDGGINFSGNGSGRLSCQDQINGLGYLPNGALQRVDDLYNKGCYKDSFETEGRFLERQLALKSAILESYRDSLSIDVYNRIWKDVIGSTYDALFATLNFNSSVASSPSFSAAKSFFQTWVKNSLIIDTSKASLLSANYASSLLSKDLLYLKFNYSEKVPYHLNFTDALQYISIKYQGSLRDKLFFLLFLEHAKYSKNVINNLDRTLSQMGNNESKNMLSEWKKHVSSGSGAFQFDLPDETGTRILLNDFHGKVVIADFWFTGCENCILIPSAMSAVCKKFAENEQVVFLSINVDNLKKWWTYGLKQGIYSIPRSIHLSTYGMGSNHPLLKYYNYDSFPQLLVIDQNGNTVASNPPNPRIDQGKGLIKMIDSLLLR